jgi:hypothetical protein
MPVGKVTVRKVKGKLTVSDESGQSYTFPPKPQHPLLLDIDPRIDLTRPIYEQVIKLQARDRAAQPATNN